MNPLIESPLFELLDGNFPPAAVLDGLLKGLILLMAIGLVALSLRKASASARHSVWLAGLVGVLALPLLAVNLPGWKVLPDNWLAGIEMPGNILALPETSAAVAEAPAVSGVLSPTGGPESSTAVPPIGPFVSFANAETSIATKAAGGGVGALTSGQWAALIWMAGTVLLLSRLLMSRLGVARLAKRARRVTGGFLEDELLELRGLLGIRRPVVLLLSTRRAIPMTWGTFRPRVLLPSEAANWKPEKRRAVLLHELSHVARRDCLSQLIGQITLAIHWFNPLVWVAVWRLSIEREHACDDSVIGNGINPPDYAELILNLSAAFPIPRLCGASAAAMVKPAGLEKRLRGILNPGRNRRSPGPGAVLAGVGCLALILFPLAMIRAEGDRKQDRAESEKTNPAPVRPADDSLIINGTRVKAEGNRIVIISDVSKSQTELDGEALNEAGHVILPNPEIEKPYRIRVGDKEGQMLFLTVDNTEENGGVLLSGARKGKEEKLLVKDQSRSDNRALMIEQLEKLRSQLAPHVREQPIELMLSFTEDGGLVAGEALGGLEVNYSSQAELDKLYREIAEELSRITVRLNRVLQSGKDGLPAPVNSGEGGRGYTEIREIDSRNVAVRPLPVPPAPKRTAAAPGEIKISPGVPSQQRIFVEPVQQPVPKPDPAPEVMRVARFVGRAETAEPPDPVFIPSHGLTAKAQPMPAADLYKLSPPISGIVQETPVKAGTRVKKGEVLMQLDDRSARNDLAIAKKQLDAAKARIELQQVETELAEKAYARMKELHSEGSTSSTEMESMERKRITARVSLNVSDAELAVTASLLSQAEIAVQQQRIVAPIDGIVESVQHKNGEYANAGVPAVILRALPAKSGGKSDGENAQNRPGWEGSTLGGGGSFGFGGSTGGAGSGSDGEEGFEED